MLDDKKLYERFTKPIKHFFQKIQELEKKKILVYVVSSTMIILSIIPLILWFSFIKNFFYKSKNFDGMILAMFQSDRDMSFITNMSISCGISMGVVFLSIFLVLFYHKNNS